MVAVFERMGYATRGALPGAVAGALLALILNATLLSAVYASFCLFVAARELVRLYLARATRQSVAMIDEALPGD